MWTNRFCKQSHIYRSARYGQNSENFASKFPSKAVKLSNLSLRFSTGRTENFNVFFIFLSFILICTLCTLYIITLCKLRICLRHSNYDYYQLLQYEHRDLEDLLNAYERSGPKCQKLLSANQPALTTITMVSPDHASSTRFLVDSQRVKNKVE